LACLYVLYICCLASLFVQFAYSFFFHDPATTEIYTLSLHDALPIYLDRHALEARDRAARIDPLVAQDAFRIVRREIGVDPREERSEEHTSELQSRENLVCRLLLEKKKKSKTR